MLQSVASEFFDAPPATPPGLTEPGHAAVTRVLAETSSADVGPAELVLHVRGLATVARRPDVVLALADFDSTGLPDEAEAAAKALETAAKSRPAGSGTPEATETLDLLDGLIIHYARLARRAAKSASKKLGTAAMVSKFSLAAMTPSRASEAPAADAVPGAGPVG